ncbi:MAG: hypothetical protein GY710_20880, partial [Desulfobacteraceae bacterium]|nr:hypothetical protein [Desulfobacteraceae bacterium]
WSPGPGSVVIRCKVPGAAGIDVRFHELLPVLHLVTGFQPHPVRVGGHSLRFQELLPVLHLVTVQAPTSLSRSVDSRSCPASMSSLVIR